MAFPPGIRLVMVPADSGITPAALKAAGVQVYARFYGTHGQWLLAGADDAGLAGIAAFGLATEMVDPSPAGGAFFRVLRRMGRPDPDFAPFGRVVWDGGDERVIRATPREAQLLAAAGFEIAAIRPRPIRLEPQPADQLPASVVADPATAGIMGQLNATLIEDYEQALTGVVAASVGGSPYTILRR